MLTIWRQIFDLLTRAQRRSFLLLTVMMGLTVVAELAGIAMILPFMAIVANPSVVETRPLLSAIYDGLGYTDPLDFLRVVGFFVFAAAMSSIAIRALTFHRITVFARGAAMSLGAALLHRYLARPYVWFLGRHSADLGKSILDEVHDVTNGAIAPAMRALANAAVLICLIAFLVVIEPVGALVMGGLFVAAFAAIYSRLDAALTNAGEDRRVAKREKHQITSEAMSGIKEVKVMGLENAYLSRFLGPSERVARHQSTVALIGEMPRYALEALTFGGMMLFVIWMLHSREGRLDEVLPVIGAFAFAGLKLMPTTQQLFRDLALVRHNQPTLAGLHGDLGGVAIEAWSDAGKHPSRAVIPLTDTLRLSDVGYRYPGADRDALTDLNIEIPAGRSVGVVGSSGAGKTTAMDIMLGLLTPDRGALSVDGTVIGPDLSRDWQRGIGYVPQSIFLVDDTIAANIAFGEDRGNIDRARVETAARLAQLDKLLSELPEGLDTWIGERGVRLSGGQRQRIGIARALYREPDLVIFDEATSALDSVTERAVIDAIRTLSGRMTIVIVTHRLATVAHCDTILVLSNGRLVGSGDHDTLAATNPAYIALLRASAGQTDVAGPDDAHPAVL